MISLTGIKDYIKTLGIGEHYSIGKIDTSLDKSVGVYSRDNVDDNIIPIGGLKNKSYDTKSVTILVHWTNSLTETEKAVYGLFDALQSASNVVIDGKEVKFIRVYYPIDVTGGESTYEYVIQCDFIAER